MKNRYDIRNNRSYEVSRVKHFAWLIVFSTIAFATIFTALAVFNEAKAASVKETECLSQIVWAEAKGESITGYVAVAEAAVKRSRSKRTSLCKMKGVSRQPVPTAVKRQTDLISRHAIDNKPSVLKKSDSWNKGTIPGSNGSIERIIGKHVFYKQMDTK